MLFRHGRENSVNVFKNSLHLKKTYIEEKNQKLLNCISNRPLRDHKNKESISVTFFFFLAINANYVLRTTYITVKFKYKIKCIEDPSLS